MKAYENMGLANYALIYDKLILSKYQGDSFIEGQQLLAQFLESLIASGSSGVYTLHVYERPERQKTMKIKMSTEPDYGFNFTLFDELDQPNEGAGYLRGVNRSIQDKILQLEAKLAAYESEEPEAVGGVQGFLNGLVEDPRTKQWIQDKIFGLADKLFSAQQSAPSQQAIPMYPVADGPGTMGKVGAVDETSPLLIDEQQGQKINQALEILARVDEKLGDNLQKIADLAAKSPVRYKSLISMLNTFI